MTLLLEDKLVYITKTQVFKWSVLAWSPLLYGGFPSSSGGKESACNTRDLGSVPQFSSVAQSCPILGNPMDCSTEGLPVHHQLPEFTQTHAHWVGDAIQPSHPLSSPSPPTFNLSQHHELMMLGENGIARVWEEGLMSFHESALHIRWPRYWSYNFSIGPSNEYSDWFPLGYTGWISLQSKGLSRIFSKTTVQKHYLVLRFLYSPTLTAIRDHWKNHSLD